MVRTIIYVIVVQKIIHRKRRQMKAYNVYISGFKVGSVFSWNIFEATEAAFGIYGMNVEVLGVL